MKIIEKHGMTEQILIQELGWKWMSYIGIPTRDTEGYPNECRVRELFSAKAMKSKGWPDFVEKCKVQEATGDEPLSYGYCSSSGPSAWPPRIIILVDD